jgi:hypothetical protein
MILCFGPNDKLQVVVGGSGIQLDCHVSGADTDNAATPTISLYRLNTAIVTTGTFDISVPPASGHTLNIKTLNICNKSGGAISVRVIHTDGTTAVNLWAGTLSSSNTLLYVEGIGWAVVLGNPAPNLQSEATSAQSGFAADTYLTGSNVQFPTVPGVGTVWRMIMDVTKTALGTATPILTVRTGTGVIGDTARLTFTFGAGTAAIDVGVMIVEAMFRSIGAGTTAVLQGRAWWVTNLSASGLSTSVKALVATSAGFDSTALAQNYIGASYNGGASAAHTIQLVRSELIL